MRSGVASEPAAADGEELSIPLVLAVILRRRRVIIVATVIGVLVGFTFALLKGKSYTSSFSFITESESAPSAGGLASLAGQFGISLGGGASGATSPQLYADLLSTREILSKVARQPVRTTDGRTVTIAQLLRFPPEDSARSLDRAVRVLRSQVITSSVATRTTGAVSVSVRTPDAQASCDIANALLRALNEYNRDMRRTRAATERQFAEARLSEIRRAEIAAENTLQQFLQGNRQFAGTSQLRFEQERLENDVSLQRQLVAELSRQVEEARIREVRDTPAISLIERPNVPLDRDPMGRLSTLAFYTLAGFSIGLVLVIVQVGWDEHRRRESRQGPYALLAEELARINPFRRRS